MLHLKEIRVKSDQFPTKDHYPFNLDVLCKTPKIEFSYPVTFFVGENGSGKSTLLEALARSCQIHIWRGEERTRAVINHYEESLFSISTPYGQMELSQAPSSHLRSFAISPNSLMYGGRQSRTD